MTTTFTRSLALCLLLQLTAIPPAQAWDATGHRLGIYLAWQSLPMTVRTALGEILEQHPRYQEDFLDQMPTDVLLASAEEQQRWLLGQAAIWPDIVRGFVGDELIRYNRPDWHWIDGAWVRGDDMQGNVYVGVAARQAVDGDAAGSVTDELDVTNVVLALEYNYGVLQDPRSPGEQKAVALCWILHLTADLHQPLHTGGLVSSELFVNGDRGGNGIPVGGGSLHSTWDEALRLQPFDDLLQRMQQSALQTDFHTVSLNTATWLRESREVLHNFAYPDEIKAAVLRSERRDARLESIALDEDYASRMQAIAEDRITVSGIRLSLILQRALGNPGASNPGNAALDGLRLDTFALDPGN